MVFSSGSSRPFLLLLLLEFVSLSYTYNGVGSLNVKCLFNYDEDRFVLKHPTLEEVEINYLDHDARNEKTGVSKGGKDGNNPGVHGLPGFLSVISQHLDFQPKSKIKGWRSKTGKKWFRHIVNEFTKGKKRVSWIEYHGHEWFAKFEEKSVNDNQVILFDKSRNMWLKLTAAGKSTASSLYWARSKRFEDITAWQYLEDGTWEFASQQD
mmetsp:Transcript_16007/g.18998  ORF Transcript_16007/g.18998 Transcript_16007/m.18998 type:complete len:209 (+) Transcript_16007:358-984(+)|eukprot:CAMPEP_0204833230 /NCGR_PEP_ID=MMETSP1346-20131115/16081_1 /ASSEMBLY_ACC=CAM_ASM_000771 /TAXON_ID=215587 /ORGANISM="Aplanochytrium stocchinoi, Strain GSBS06" /LENGTH=208 /DNA_ID=CAMNT_0051965583 /DNA_START=245 /DNA_END=871 /DNA_ORIENTATION=-